MSAGAPSMRFAIESWSPDYGSPMGDEPLVPTTAEVDAAVEVPPSAWAPRSAPAATPPVDDLLFVDGVRRVEAHVWITAADGGVHQGLCASYAAGAVHCNGAARLVEPAVERVLLAPAEGAGDVRTRHATFPLHAATGDDVNALSLLLQRLMGDLEQRAAAAAGPVDLVVVDGPLKQGQSGAGIVGYVKTHHTEYGPPVVREVVTRLAVGQRTPLLLVKHKQSRLARFTWYQRLPCAVAHGMAGIVRLEATADRPVGEVAAIADRLCVTLGRYASCEQKDPRAPQNLYPVGGLERELRRRLGDPALIFRSLREAASRGAVA